MHMKSMQQYRGCVLSKSVKPMLTQIKKLQEFYDLSSYQVVKKDMWL